MYFRESAREFGEDCATQQDRVRKERENRRGRRRRQREKAGRKKKYYRYREREGQRHDDFDIFPPFFSLFEGQRATKRAR